MGGEVYKGHCSLPVLNIEFTSEVVARARSPTRREIYLLPLDFSASLTPSLRTPLVANSFPSCRRGVLTWTVKLYFELVFERRAFPLSVLK